MLSWVRHRPSSAATRSRPSPAIGSPVVPERRRGFRIFRISLERLSRIESLLPTLELFFEEIFQRRLDVDRAEVHGGATVDREAQV